jgi:hypothetical protein
MFNQGDLVHIPGNVVLYSYESNNSIIWATEVSKKPHLAIFLENCGAKYASVVTESGDRWIVERDDLHFKESHNAS